MSVLANYAFAYQISVAIFTLPLVLGNPGNPGNPHGRRRLFLHDGRGLFTWWVQRCCSLLSQEMDRNGMMVILLPLTLPSDLAAIDLNLSDEFRKQETSSVVLFSCACK